MKLHSRKMRLALLVAGVTAAVAVVAAPPSPNAAPVVHTASGQVRGFVDAGTLAFLGIPYGASTGGANRFLPPQKPASWSKVRDATEFGPRCPQKTTDLGGEMQKAVNLTKTSPMSEDCLSLNVWTPSLAKTKRPVMVWLHGGGFSEGSSRELFYRGANLSRENDLIVVSINHRLNGFGFLDLSSVLGPKYAESANNSFLDIVAALRWVHDNIAQFGGDPGNVTIFGQSGGGAKVLTLYGMPAAQGLFHKGIAMSGGGRLRSQSDAKVATDAVLAEFPGTREQQAKALLGASTDQLLDVLVRAKYPQPAGPANSSSRVVGYAAMSSMFGPVIDGKVMPTPIWETDAPAISDNIPLMIGTTSDEMTSMLMMDPTWPGLDDATLKAKVEGMLGAERGDKVLAFYRAKYPSYQPMHILSAIMSDSFFTKSAIHNAELKAARHTAPVYLYKTVWNTPALGGKLKAAHGIDTPLFFDNIDVARGFVGPGEEPVVLDKALSGIIAAFARTGVPDVPGQPHWPAFDPETRETMLFSVPLKVVRDPDSDSRMLWAQTR